MKSLLVSEIYRSIQGESSFAGLPCTFIRLTGCPLRCRWCDTVYNFEGKQALTLAEIIRQVDEWGVPLVELLVELTGGEPLAQPASVDLLQALVAHGYQVLIETSGALDLGEIPPQVHIIMDLKCPASGMVARNRWQNLSTLKPSDEIKFVIASRADFDWTCQVIADYRLEERFHLLLSPAWGLVQAKVLVAWMLEAKLRARLNLQQHKYIWGPRVKGV